MTTRRKRTPAVTEGRKKYVTTIPLPTNSEDVAAVVEYVRGIAEPRLTIVFDSEDFGGQDLWTIREHCEGLERDLDGYYPNGTISIPRPEEVTE